MEHFTSRISRKLVLYIVLFSSVITLFLTGLQLLLDYRHGLQEIHQRFHHIDITNLESFRQAMWTIDKSSLQIQMDGVSRISDIIHVEMLNEQGKSIAQSGTYEARDTITHEFPITQLYRDREIPLGTLIVTATKRNLYQQLVDTAVVILVSQAIKTFIVSLFMFFIFYFLVARHLDNIATYLKKLDLSRKPTLLNLDKQRNREVPDELDQATDAINRMTSNIYQSYEKASQNQRILAEREAKLSAILESITDAIVIANTDRKITQVNTAFSELFGYAADEALGQTTQFLYANPDDYLAQQTERFNTQTLNRPSLYEISYRRKDGTVFPSETMGGAIILNNQNPIGFIGVIRNIEYRKKSERETLELQKQLHSAQKLEAIGQLTGGIAHDFNNILGSIIGYADLSKHLLEKSDNEKLKRYIDNIDTAGERAKNLVAQLLAFSRQTPSTIESLDLKPVIKEIITLLRPLIPSTISINTNIQERVPRVCMDATQMHQLIINLCINARDAIDSHGIITIHLRHQQTTNTRCSSCSEPVSGDYVVLAVEDNGSGIDPDIVNKVFDPFQTTKAVGNGTGMGLSVVHGILHNQNGHILVETRRHSGSTFSMLIPPCHEVPQLDNVTSGSLETDKHFGDNKHILIVDDESPITSFFTELLEGFGFKVTAVNDSREALNLFHLSPNTFDLVITDQTMPNMTGTDLFKAIRKINSSIPVILCSGYSKQVGEKDALELGFSSYMHKPIRKKELLKNIKTALNALPAPDQS